MIMVNYVLISKFEELTGYTEAAIRTKIRDGVWLEDVHFTYAPDNRILINLEKFNQWVETAAESRRRQNRATKSPSPIAARAAAKESSSSPAPLI